MFEQKIREAQLDPERDCDLIEVIAYLYNSLHKVVTGEDYKYFFHWGNHIGYSVTDVDEIEDAIYKEPEELDIQEVNSKLIDFKDPETWKSIFKNYMEDDDND